MTKRGTPNRFVNLFRKCLAALAFRGYGTRISSTLPSTSITQQSQLFFAADRKNDIDQMPLIARTGPFAFDAIGKMATKGVHPLTDGFPTDDRFSFRKQIFNINRAQGKPMIRPNGIRNDFTGKRTPLRRDIAAGVYISRGWLNATAQSSWSGLQRL